MFEIDGSSQSTPARWRAPRALAALALIFCVGAAAQAGAAEASRQVASFIDDFSAPDDTGRLTDMSAASFAQELTQTRSDLARLRAIDSKALTPDEKIDWQVAHSVRRAHDIEQAEKQKW